MAKKKGNANAQVSADHEPEAAVAAAAETGGASPDQAHLDGDGGASAAGETAEHTGEPAGPDHEDAVAELVNGEGGDALDDEQSDLAGPENHVDAPSFAPADGVIQAAEEASSSVLFNLSEFHEFPPEEMQRLAVMVGHDDSSATNMMAKFARHYGPQVATASVLCHQMRILGLVERSEPTPAEELLASVFLSVLFGIDAFDAGEEERRAAAAHVPPVPRPVPLDETVGELVEGPMEMGR